MAATPSPLAKIQKWWAPLSKKFYKPSHESGRDIARLQTIHKMLWKLVLESPVRREPEVEKWMAKELHDHVDSYLDVLNYNRTGSIICTSPRSAFVRAGRIPMDLEAVWLGHHCLQIEELQCMHDIEWEESKKAHSLGDATRVCVICENTLYDIDKRSMHHIGKMVIGACVCSDECSHTFTMRFVGRVRIP
jgi:hypothetical protein